MVAGDGDGAVTLTIATNGITGGKNAPRPTGSPTTSSPSSPSRGRGRHRHCEYQPPGVDDEQYKSKLALDLKAGSGADIIAIDGIWVGEFAQAGYIKPLTEVVGRRGRTVGRLGADQGAGAGQLSFQDERYGVPAGTDGRVIFFNKKLFEQAACRPTGSRRAGTRSLGGRPHSSRASTASPRCN